MLSIIIPTKDRLFILKNSLRYLIEATKSINVEIIIVNDSKTENLQELKSEFCEVTIIRNLKHGVASARNFGASLAKGDWLLFLDDDMIVFESNIKAYEKYMHSDERVTINLDWIYSSESLSQMEKNSFGRFLIKYGFTSLKGWNNWEDWKENDLLVAKGITSQNLLIKKSVFDLSGGYNELFPMAGFEDYAFTSTLKLHNFVMYIDTHSKMIHNEIDRLSPTMWFERKKRGAITRKIAVGVGYKELEIKYTFVKHVFYYFFKPTKFLLNLFLFFSTKSKKLDIISFSLYKILLGLYIYKGYNSNFIEKNA